MRMQQVGWAEVLSTHALPQSTVIPERHDVDYFGGCRCALCTCRLNPLHLSPECLPLDHVKYIDLYAAPHSIKSKRRLPPQDRYAERRSMVTTRSQRRALSNERPRTRLSTAAVNRSSKRTRPTRAQHEPRAPVLQDALDYVDTIKSRRPEVYQSFLDALNDRDHGASTSNVLSSIAYLLGTDDALDLVQSLRRFLPRQRPTIEQRQLRGVYEPLNASKFETRFVNILPAANEDAELACEVKIASLFEPPPFVALSYCWGDKEDLRDITINGCTRKITANLEAALKRLREFDDGPLWVDAICINQEDDFEKAYQVSRMGTIFSKATKVLAWLGDDEDSLQRVIEPLKQGDELLKQMDAVAELLARPYFERIWVVQEIAVACSIEIRAGSKSTAWDSFMDELQVKLRLSQHSFLQAESLRTLQRFRQREEAHRYDGTPKIDLTQALVLTQHTQASDARDKIYALLSLTCDGTKLVPGVNYRKPAYEVVEEVMRNLISIPHQTTLLLLAGTRNHPFPEAASWLPMWPLLEVRQLPGWVRKGFGSNAIHPSYHIEVKNRELLLRGVQLEVICRQTSAPSGTTPVPKSLRSETSTVFNSICRALRAGISDEMTDISPSDQSIAELMAWYLSNAEDKNTQYSSPALDSWFNANDHVCILGRSISTWLRLHCQKTVLPALKHPSLGTILPLENSLEMLQRYSMAPVPTGAILDEPIHLRVCSNEVEPGDHIYWLDGCPLPMALRLMNSETSRYRVIGEVLGVETDGPSWGTMMPDDSQLLTLI